MNRLQIPDIVIPTFKEFAKISSKEVEGIVCLLKEFPIGGNFDDLQLLIKKSEYGKRIPDLDETLLSFGSLLVDQDGADVTELAKDLANAYAEKIGEVSVDESERLQNNLRSIFESADSLKKTFKAYYLFTNNDHIYQNSNVVTDARLLFNDSLEDQPTCGVIVHQLKLEYAESNRRKSFFVSMNREDLVELNETIQRALKKEEIIRNNQSNIHFITLK